ncbi:MAG: hypothetical protein ACJA1E_002164 [Paracoccaceae bacterium]|jgi:hypothetical protein
MAEMLHVHGPRSLWRKAVGTDPVARFGGRKAIVIYLVERVWCQRLCLL